jgi:hypothetical protein
MAAGRSQKIPSAQINYAALGFDNFHRSDDTWPSYPGPHPIAAMVIQSTVGTRLDATDRRSASTTLQLQEWSVPTAFSAQELGQRRPVGGNGPAGYHCALAQRVNPTRNDASARQLRQVQQPDARRRNLSRRPARDRESGYGAGGR